MTIRLQSLTPTIDAAPGEVVIGRLRLSNDAAREVTVTIAVIGLAAADPGGAATTAAAHAIEIAAGASVDVTVPIAVPDLLGIGQHAAAFEVRSGSDKNPALCPFTLSVPSVERILMTAQPSTIRGRRRSKFVLDFTNHESETVVFTVDAAAPGVRVRFEQSAFQLLPGEQTYTRAKVLGPRKLGGERTQHNILITARGRAASTSTTVPYVQRPLIASRLRTAVAVFAVLALFATGLVGVWNWRQNRAEDALNNPPTTIADADADAGGDDAGGDDATPGDANTGADPDSTSDGSTAGAPDATGGAGDTGGSAGGGAGDGTGSDATSGGGAGGDGTAGGGDGTTTDGSANAPSGGAAGSDGAVEEDRPLATSAVATSVTGTVTVNADDGDSPLDGVTIKLRELQLGEQPSAAAALRGVNGIQANRNAKKIWSARYNAAPNALGPVRQTVPIVRDNTPNDQGIWMFGEVPLQRTYELVFQKPGFQTKAFVIEPPDDGSLVEVDVSLDPGEGSIDGTVSGTLPGERNASITLTDGTLTFSTTATSDTGVWNIEGLSTPAVYTLTAVLPGYETVVQQVTIGVLDPDQNVNVQMRAGLATVRGRVTGPDGPIGGATISVSGRNGTLTTTTRTEGDVGSYSIPGLELDGDNPQVITVTVDHDAFRRESVTRRVNATDINNVNFVLRSDMIRLTGVVSDIDTGVPLEGAFIELSTRDLIFTAQTGAIDPGRFAVADLPPGEYVVSVSLFKYEPVIRQITLQQGVAPGDLLIGLKKLPPSDDARRLRGDLTIKVIDPEGANQAEREVEGALVKLIDPSTGLDFTDTDPDVDLPNPNPFPTNASSNEVRYNVPIGTYTIEVTHDEYNTAPREEVTVGLSGQTVEIEIDKKLKAGGRLVDSVSGNPITDYKLTVTREKTPQTPEKVFELEAVNGEWETDESLITGTYNVVVTESTGYRIRTDQVIDPTLNGVNRFMRFEVRTSLTEKLVLNDIRADPFAVVTGRVFAPTVDGAGTVRLKAIDEPALAVTMKCRGKTAGAVAKTADAAITDELDVQGVPDATLFDTFTFPKEVFAEQQLDSANCEINASAGPVYTGVGPILLSNVTVSNGAALTDRIVNLALAKPIAVPFKGNVFWVDPRDPARNPIPVGAIRIQTIGAGAITGFQPSISGPLQNEIEPKPIFDSIETLTTNNPAAADVGRWELGGQIVGGTIYRLQDTTGNGFADGTIRVIIDGDGRRTVEALTGTKITFDAANGNYDIELFPAKPGEIEGTVRLLTTHDVFPKTKLKAYAPNNDPNNPASAGPDFALEVKAPVPNNVTGAESTFDIKPAAAGTWTIQFDPPPNYRFLDPASASIDRRVEPGRIHDTGFDTTLVEMGRVNLTLQDSFGNAIGSTATTTVTHTGGPGGALQTALDSTPAIVEGFYADEAFNTATGKFERTTHAMTVDVAGYDHNAAQATVTYPPGELPPVAIPTQVPPVDGIEVLVALRPGSRLPVTIKMPKYGIVIGRVVGQRASSAIPEPLVIGDGQAVVTAKAYDNVNNTEFGPALDVRPATLADFEFVCPVPGNLELCDLTGTFVFSGPPGYYQVRVSHPEFTDDDTPPADIAPAGTPTWPRPTPLTAPGVYGIGNNATNDTRHPTLAHDSWTLIERTTDLHLNVSSMGMPRANGATRFTLTSTSNPLDTRSELVPDGGIITGLAPLQQYTLKIESETGTPAAFPAITTITAPRSIEGDPRVVVVTVVLPPLKQEIIATVTAQNSAMKPVALPAGVTVEADFDSSHLGILVDDNTGTNVKPNLAETTTQATAAVVNAWTATYTFPVAAGDHRVFASSTPDPIPGFLALAPSEFNITRPGTTAPLFTYVAKDVRVVVALGPGDYPNLTWELRASDNQLLQSSSWPAGYDIDVDNNLTIEGVPPELNDFTLTIDSDLHESTPKVVNIPAEPDGVVNFSMTLPPDMARLSVALKENPGTGPLVDLRTAGTTVSFVPTLSGAPISTTVGAYEYTTALSAASTHKMTVNNPDLVAGSINVTLTPGFITKRNLTLDAVAVIDVTVVRKLVTPASAAEVVAPPGLAVALVDTAGTRYAMPTANGNAHQFKVPGGIGYWVEINANIYPNAFFVDAPNGLIFPVAIGQLISRQVPIPRVVTVDLTAPSPATVTARIGTVVDTKTVPPFRFDYSGASAAALGVGTVKITAPLHRTKLLTIPDQLITTFDSATANLLPTVTVSGTVGLPAGKPFTVTTPEVTVNGVTLAAVTLNGTTSDGNYSMGGLDVGPDGQARTWTVRFDAPGYGTANHVLPQVTGNSASMLAGQNITLVPMMIPFTFSVWNGSVDPVVGLVGATVTVKSGNTTVVSGQTAVVSSPGPGTVTLNVRENVLSPMFAVTNPSYITPVDIALWTDRLTTRPTPVPVPVTAVTLYQLKGGGSGAVSNKKLTIEVCPIANANCGTDQKFDVNTDGTFSFVFASPPPAGQMYDVTASQPGETAKTIRVTIGSDGAVSPAIIFDMTPPPPPP